MTEYELGLAKLRELARSWGGDITIAQIGTSTMADFRNTIEALRVWDATKPDREKVWDNAIAGLVELKQAEDEDAKAQALVHAAFHEDTKHVNSLDRCRLVHPDDPWLRRLVSNATR